MNNEKGNMNDQQKHAEIDREIEAAFQTSFELIQFSAHRTAVSKGWWSEERDLGTIIALMHSELSEALEYGRNGNQPSDHIPEFTGIEEEFADVIIRIMDYSQKNGIRVSEAILAKMKFNASRPHKHGGKRF